LKNSDLPEHVRAYLAIEIEVNHGVTIMSGPNGVQCGVDMGAPDPRAVAEKADLALAGPEPLPIPLEA
jgi:hypothetical protein